MNFKNTKDKAMGALKRIKGVVRDVAHPVYAAKRKIAESKTRAADNQYKTYKMVNDARGRKDKGNSSDPLFRARQAMKDAQKRSI